MFKTSLVCLLSSAFITFATMPSTVAARPDIEMAQSSAAFRHLADSFVAHAMAGSVDAIQAMISQSMLSQVGATGLRRALETQIVPFFMQGREPGKSVTITHTTDATGNHGYAFYMWMQPTGNPSGKRPFTVYTVREQGKLRIANIVPDRLVEGRHQ